MQAIEVPLIGPCPVCGGRQLVAFQALDKPAAEPFAWECPACGPSHLSVLLALIPMEEANERDQ